MTNGGGPINSIEIAMSRKKMFKDSDKLEKVKEVCQQHAENEEVAKAITEA